MVERTLVCRSECESSSLVLSFMRKRTEKLFVEGGGSSNRSPAQMRKQDSAIGMAREDDMSFSSSATSSSSSFSLSGTAHKVAQKVRKIGGLSPGRHASSSSARSGAGSAHSSLGSSFRQNGKVADQVIDEDEIVMEATRASSDDVEWGDDERPMGGGATGHGGGSGLVSGLRSAWKVPAFLGKIVDMNHKDYARVGKTSTVTRRTTSSEGLMFASKAADENQTHIPRGDSATTANSNGSFSFFSTPRRMFSNAYGGGGGSTSAPGTSRKSSADVASPWVCFGSNDDMSPSPTPLGSGARDNAVLIQSGPAPLTDDQEYENLIKQLQRELRISREKLAAVTHDLARQQDLQRQREETTDDEVTEMKREEHDARLAELHAEIARLRAERAQNQFGEAQLAMVKAELDTLRSQHANLQSELNDAVAAAEKATGRVEELELEVRVYKNLANESSDFHDKDVKDLLAIATEEVRKHLLQVRSNSTKAKQRSVLRQFQSRYHPDKNVILQPLFEEIFKIIATEARLMCLDI